MALIVAIPAVANVSVTQQTGKAAASLLQDVDLEGAVTIVVLFTL